MAGIEPGVTNAFLQHPRCKRRTSRLERNYELCKPANLEIGIHCDVEELYAEQGM